MYNENCDGGFCCATQCVKNSLACQDLLHFTPTQSQRSEDETHESTAEFPSWEFALIVLGSVIAGVLLCILCIWGCRAIISRI